MNLLTFTKPTNDDLITTAILIKNQHLNHDQLVKSYVTPLANKGVPPEHIIAVGLDYDKKTVSAAFGKQQLDDLLPVLADYPQLSTIIVADAAYFKLLGKSKVVKKYYGENILCEYAGYEDYRMVYVPNWASLFYDPGNQHHIDTGLAAVMAYQKKEIVENGIFLRSPSKAKRMFQLLHKCHSLSCDIETTGLPLGSELVSISFAWSTKRGCSIYLYGRHKRKLLNQLKEFFDTYQGKLIFHRALFDVKHLIWLLYMSDPKDLPGMLLGLRVFRHVEDSQLLTYLALNSTTDVSLGLKENSYEFTGNYGIEVKDASRVPPDKLLQYNLKDALATRYVWNKYWHICEKEQQLKIYTELFQPSISPLLKMMLVGLPIDLNQVKKVKDKLEAKQLIHERLLENHPIIKQFTIILQQQAMEAANSKLKKKFHPFSHFSNVTFNPASDPQVRQLIYEHLKYPVLAVTDTGLASTKAKVLEQLLGQGKHDDIINALIERGKTSIILSTFITAFEKYTIDGFLHGELNLGGTQSGRLSSSNPNLQNQPSGSTYGKLIKSCFRTVGDWLLWGIDFNALEERIGAILSNDPNRIKVYTQGFDGHCLRAFRYFGSLMSGVDPDDPASINSIQARYPELRNRSKAPTFALQYMGTFYTLMKSCGIPKEEALAIERAYHELYAASDDFAQRNIEFANKHGYIEIAFGLRLRTPLLHQSVINTTHTPYSVKAEGRSANNATTQSWGLLINRALIEANQKIEESSYCYDILPANTVHDAIYGVVRNNPEAIAFLNKTIVAAMEWNAHPKIYSKEVPMAAQLELGYSWDTLQNVPNNATPKEINEIIKNL